MSFQIKQERTNPKAICFEKDEQTTKQKKDSAV